MALHIRSLWIAALILLVGMALFSDLQAAVTAKASEYARIQGLSAANLAKLESTGYLTGQGEVEYRLPASRDGWYTLSIGATNWPADLYIDDKFWMRTAFQSDLWQSKDGLHRIGNVFLAKGMHKILIRKQSFPGLPWVTRVELEFAHDVTSMSRAIPEGNSLVRRAGEELRVRIQAGKLRTSYKLRSRVRLASTGAFLPDDVLTVPAGSGIFETDIHLPTSTEGAFRFFLVDGIGRPVDRGFEYVVVDTKTPSAPKLLSTSLVQTISLSKRPPDYASGETGVDTVIGRQVRQSGPKGEVQSRGNGDYFAYNLTLPTTQDLYLVQVDYPDDRDRAFSISLVEEAVNPYALDGGIVTGGNYSRSYSHKTFEMYFYPRQKNPRILFLNWQQGGAAAASEIRVYRVENGLPSNRVPASERRYGLYFEEPLRFTTYFGATAEGNTWHNLLTAALRYGEWSQFQGINAWRQAAAVYQTTLWPAEGIPGYGADDEPDFGMGVVGPISSNDFFQKDILRLMLLVCEKYGIDFVPEIAVPPNEFLKRHLDEQFSNADGTKKSADVKPWMIVSQDGKGGLSDPFYPYFNPVHPSVQRWIGDLMSEVANRYKDSKAFKGIAIRLMGWSFASWQAFPSIKWGYDDYTIEKFASDTGVRPPGDSDDPNRFAQRYDWLSQNDSEVWINWRVDQITKYYESLATALDKARPGLRLYIDTLGPHFSVPEFWDNPPSIHAIDSKGWLRLIKESGIDPRRFANNPSIVFSNATLYPPGVRVKDGIGSALSRDLYRQAGDPAPVVLSEKSTPDGSSVAFTRFMNHYMEADFPFARIGMTGFKKQDSFRICAALVPSGNSTRQRYADSLANGNIVEMIDGGLGYVLGQPNDLSQFVANFLLLPRIPMHRIDTGTQSAFAAWTGERKGVTYSYVVNRSPEPVDVTLRFDAPTSLVLLYDEAGAPPIGPREFRIRVAPFGLVSMRSESGLVKVSGG